MNGLFRHYLRGRLWGQYKYYGIRQRAMKLLCLTVSYPYNNRSFYGIGYGLLLGRGCCRCFDTGLGLLLFLPYQLGFG